MDKHAMEHLSSGRKGTRSGVSNKWRKYEKEKRALMSKNLSPTKYEAAIAALAQRLGI